jgi:MOSC domain-containing protein YiiM
MKTAVRLNDNYAGIYATVVKTGELRVGQSVLLGED